MAHRTIHVGNVGSNISEEGLLTFFSSVGEVTNIKLAGDPSYPSRFAFVEFAEPSYAHSACKLTGADVGGKPVKIMIAKKAITTPFLYGSRNTATPHPQPASDPTPRTIYVSGIDTSLPESQILEFFSTSGQVTNHRFCGDSTLPQRFAFVEFADPNMAQASVSMSGTVLGKYPIRIMASKSAIQNAVSRGNYTNEQLDMIARTIHVGNLDIGVGESYIREMFEGASGTIVRVAIAGETSYQTRFAFIEFKHKSSAQDALKMNGVIVAGKQIRVNLSRSPIMINHHDHNGGYSHYNERYSPEQDYRQYRSHSPEREDHLNLNNEQQHVEQQAVPPTSLPLSPDEHSNEDKKKNDLSPARDVEEESDDEESDSGSEEGDSSDEESDSEDDDSESDDDESGKKRRKKQNTNGPDRKKIKK